MWMNQNLLAIFHQINEDAEAGTNIYTDTLFENLHIPESVWTDPAYTDGWTIYKETLVKLILWRYGEQCSIIGDPNSLAEAIDFWSASNLPTWQALYQSIFLKYNPVQNMDYTISESGSHSKTGSETNTGNRSETGTEIHDNTDTYNETIDTETTYGKTVNNSESETHTGNESNSAAVTTTTDNTETESLTAYNESTFTNSKRNVLDGDGSSTSNSNKTNTDTNVKTSNNASGGEDNENKTHTGTVDYDSNISRNSNITDTNTGIKSENGTTTNDRHFSGSMIKGDIMTAIISWREYRNVNMYEIIAKEFAKEFLIMVW